MRDEEREFFRAGLSHYPQAARAVTRFREMVQAELDAALYETWKSDEKIGHAPFSDLALIESWQRVKLPTGDVAGVAAGVEWEPTGGYWYAYCWEGPEWAKRPTGPQFEKYDRYNYLKQPFDPDVEAPRAIRDVVKAFAAALQSSEVTSSKKRPVRLPRT